MSALFGTHVKPDNDYLKLSGLHDLSLKSHAVFNKF